MADESVLLAYVGRGLGSEPSTDLGAGRFIQWNRSDKQVRAVPSEIAVRLVRAAPGQFVPVDTLSDAAKRHSIKADRLAELGAAGKVHTATFARRGEEPQTVVILDELTAAGVKAEHKSAGKAKDKE